jgi:deoxycytidylate deaminase
MFPLALIRHENPELFFAVVAPVGADLDKVCEHLSGALQKFDYRLEQIRVISLLKKFESPRFLQNEPANEYEKVKGRMDAGDEFRNLVQRDDALALLALYNVWESRQKFHSDSDMEPVKAALTPVYRQAFLFRSLKRPEEVTALRRIYGSNLITIGVHCAREQRVQNLSERIARSIYRTQAEKYRDKAEELVLRDEADETKAHGQRLRSAFSMADVFLDASDAKVLTEDIERFLNLLFGKPVITPTKAEVGMAHAHVAAVKSAEMGRQVGSAIINDLGHVIAMGSNEVPRQGGGTYWERETPDFRDWQKGKDSSDEFKRASLGELLDSFSKNGKLAAKFAKKSTASQIEEVLPQLKQTRYMQLIEFVRAVHAEMGALMDAAIRGVSVRNCTMYVTTFPCHECARHIIAAGIGKVFYIEPYAKSLAVELHEDALQLDSDSEPGKVPFLPFLGIAPRAYSNLFVMPDRKKEDGTVIDWNERSANPRVSGSFWSYVQYEKEDVDILEETFQKKGLKLNQQGRNDRVRKAKNRSGRSAKRRATVAALAKKRRSPRAESKSHNSARN